MATPELQQRIINNFHKMREQVIASSPKGIDGIWHGADLEEVYTKHDWHFLAHEFRINKYPDVVADVASGQFVYREDIALLENTTKFTYSYHSTQFKDVLAHHLLID